jgi:hypothetical protein
MTMLYNMLYSTTRDRKNRLPARVNSRPRQTKLIAIEESVLIKWILSMNNRGLAPRAPAVKQMANLLLAKQLDINDKKSTVRKN